jgi:hypothetical protein
VIMPADPALFSWGCFFHGVSLPIHINTAAFTKNYCSFAV